MNVETIFYKYCAKIEGFISDCIEGCESNADQWDAVCDFSADYICDREGYSDNIRPAAKRIATYYFGERE